MANLNKPAPDKKALKTMIRQFLLKLDAYLESLPKPQCDPQSVENQNIKR